MCSQAWAPRTSFVVWRCVRGVPVDLGAPGRPRPIVILVCAVYCCCFRGPCGSGRPPGSPGFGCLFLRSRGPGDLGGPWGPPGQSRSQLWLCGFACPPSRAPGSARLCSFASAGRGVAADFDRRTCFYRRNSPRCLLCPENQPRRSTLRPCRGEQRFPRCGGNHWDPSCVMSTLLRLLVLVPKSRPGRAGMGCPGHPPETRTSSLFEAEVVRQVAAGLLRLPGRCIKTTVPQDCMPSLHPDGGCIKMGRRRVHQRGGASRLGATGASRRRVCQDGAPGGCIRAAVLQDQGQGITTAGVSIWGVRRVRRGGGGSLFYSLA